LTYGEPCRLPIYIKEPELRAEYDKANGQVTPRA
jgi:hypothetical protein